MGKLSNKIQRWQLKIGDHIYTWRLGGIYGHHVPVIIKVHFAIFLLLVMISSSRDYQGIYVGDGKVIHLTRAPGPIIFSSRSNRSSSYHPSGADRVECCSIEEFLSGGDLKLYHYGVNRALFSIKRGGTCTLTHSDPPEKVRQRAFVHLGKDFGGYDLLGNNCEDFAIYIKTGLRRKPGKRNFVVPKWGRSNFAWSGQVRGLINWSLGFMTAETIALLVSL
ncbi:hypothetical protein FNV43_RR25055 [Rhamnella rubrinervis]|uniref:LRAT domain-containing protein n=1 Tax=Rhamnella rubrinervis TaxID=2594499 RepID=A0A8K0DMN5_9ROSA|nr:hypothetical protein FNV43_RR25055 [Rhamnella rubrinervis]